MAPAHSGKGISLRTVPRGDPSKITTDNVDLGDYSELNQGGNYDCNAPPLALNEAVDWKIQRLAAVDKQPPAALLPSSELKCVCMFFQMAYYFPLIVHLWALHNRGA